MSVFTNQPVSAQAAASSADVILHAFDWSYQKVANEAERIAQLGYDSVLVSPAMTSPAHSEWWNRYQPQDYRVINNPLGNTHDFIAMQQALAAQGIRLYLDVVFNHMANESHVRTDLTYPNAETLAQYQAQAEHFNSLKLFGDLSQPLFTEQDFEPAFPITNWLDASEVQKGRLSSSETDPGLPTLAPTNNVVAQQQSYIQAMKTLGVTGFRIDAAKHLSPDHIAKVWTDDICQGVKIFSEIITDGGEGKTEYEVFLKPFIQTTCFDAYDFPLFHKLLNVFKYDGSMTSLQDLKEQGQCLEAKRAITFAVTHDIPNNDVFRNQMLSPQQEQLVYCYLLGCSDGAPLIYTDQNTSNDLDALGYPRWEQSWHDNTLLKMIQFHKKVHGQPVHILKATDDVLVVLRGTEEKPVGIVAINKGNEEHQINLPNGAFSANQFNMWLGGDDLLQHTLTLPAQSGVMLLA
ncbi:alpha-amylase family glycosyl hydrolase [Vibrio gangliei]|uniref:alpha-amylase family glycosyl hydrolase n=1 Tax=Vibrio gangliei TaxID=2077090 RepID=UPI000D018616|nr:alpha-amylase family glycosyl hydrolase [Vibrio gangliei]